MTTGQRIKAARKAVGITQKELGEKLGLSFQSIAQWENDLRKPKKETLWRIAKALNISLSLLLTKDEMEIFDSGVSEGQDAADWVLRELEGYSFSKTEHFLISAFRELNDCGQQKAVERVEELTEIPRYRIQDAPQQPPQSSEGTDTTQGLGGSDEAQCSSDE